MQPETWHKWINYEKKAEIIKEFIFQQDNDAIHSSRLCRGYLEHEESEGTLKMVWPPESPDLKPTQLLWEELDGNIHDRCLSLHENMLRALYES